MGTIVELELVSSNDNPDVLYKIEWKGEQIDGVFTPFGKSTRTFVTKTSKKVKLSSACLRILNLEELQQFQPLGTDDQTKRLKQLAKKQRETNDIKVLDAHQMKSNLLRS